MKWRIIYLLILFSQSVIIMGSPDPRHFDIRVAEMADLRRTNSVVEFHDGNIFGYNSVEAYWKDETVYVSARNTVLKLSYRNGLIKNDSFTWKPLKSSIRDCLKKGNRKDDCQYNYIKIMLLFNATEHSPRDALFICGTMAEVPQCSERSTQDISKMLNWYNGKYRCPYNPSSSVTTILASDGVLYLGSVTGPAGRDYAIFRRNQGRSKHQKIELHTKHKDQRYLLDPTFISSHEIGDYVYFFFRETSYELKTSCSRQNSVTISRVARVCKNDTGNSHQFRPIRGPNLWTSFLKARIVCQRPPDRTQRFSSAYLYEYPYDLITSTFVDWSEKTLYATFMSSRSGAAGSVLCRYRIDDLKRVFESEYLVQSRKSIREWVKKPNIGNVGCPRKGETRSSNANRAFDSVTYHLVSEDYKPRDGSAIFVRNGERWSKVVKTEIETNRRNYTVLFVATDVGRIHKIVKIKAKFCLIEILELAKNAPVSDITLVTVRSSKTSYLIASTPKTVVRLDLHRCARWHTRELCLEAQDPYCGWDSGRAKCSPVLKRPPGIKKYDQLLSACPDVKRSLDGQWSTWGQWKACDQFGSSPNQCLCRHRKCDNPPAMYGGRICIGNSIEVANCTIDGGWTSWTPWSACDHTCGNAHRWRTRSCEGPRPQFGGRRCVGPRREEQKCQNSPPCPPMKPNPVHGNWASWNSWSPCTQKCNTGFRNRSRTCTAPTPKNEGNPCLGNSWEYAKCNTMICKTIEKYSVWTPWIRNWGRPITMMKRYRFQCISAVPELSMLKTRMHSEHRKCEPSDNCRKYALSSDLGKAKPGSLNGLPNVTPITNGDAIQVTGPDEDGGWSQWGPWTSCTQTCGTGGRQVRQRKCNQPSPSGLGKTCEEEAEQTRACHNGPCPNGQWTCWSDWSDCPCGEKTRTRDRQCLNPEGFQSLSCPGKSQQYDLCNNEKCARDLWDTWSEWSPCRGGRKLRSRNCHQADPSLRKISCAGPAREESACFNKGRSVSMDDSLTFNIYHLIFVGITTYLLGCASLASIYFCCYKPAGGCRGRKHQDSNPIVRPPRPGPGPGSSSTHQGYIPGTSVSGRAGAYLEDASLLSSQWVLQPRRGPHTLDRHHSFHGAGGATTLGRQYSNASSSGVYTHASTSVRGGRLDNYERWMHPPDSEAFAYTTFRRPPSHSTTRPMPDDGPSDTWEMLATRVRTLSQGEPTSTTPMLVNPLHRLERRDSEHDSVFTNSRLDGAESRQLLHSPYSVDS